MTTAEELSRSERHFLIAPAGCGKTELIAQAIVSSGDAPQLVLTHTHAGVSALRTRLRRYGVPQRSISVDTIAGFSLRYAASYPQTSGLVELKPTGSGWNEVYGAAKEVLSRPIGRSILRASYRGVYVDEYQDCTVDQHNLIVALAEVLPCRVLGDPLQGIFGFAGTLVNWDRDVPSEFQPLSQLSTPWRWMNSNRTLGEWLLSAREPLLRGERLDMEGAPVRIDRATPAKQVLVCHQISQQQGSVVGIRKWRNDAHAVARNLGGRFTSMEEMECTDLVKTSKMLDAGSAAECAIAMVEFASLCMTKVKSELSLLVAKLSEGREPTVRVGSATEEAASAVIAMSRSEGLDCPLALTALLRMQELPGVKIFRRELLNEMQKALKSVRDGAFSCMSDAAWAIRDQARHQVRTLDYRLISRALLVKGLEFDHCIVLNADEWNAKELYVAITRGSRSLTVLTSDGEEIVTYSGAT